MGELRLYEPGLYYEKQVMSYRETILASGETLVGCGNLEEATDLNDWLRRNRVHSRLYGGPIVYLALRKSDRKVIGMIEYWPMQTAYVLSTTGSLRFSVLPGERGKGYASEMVEKMLGKCWEMGSERLTVLCEKTNQAAVSAIEHCGGILLSAESGEKQELLQYVLHTKRFIDDEDDIDFDWFTEKWYRPDLPPGHYPPFTNYN